MISVPHDPHQCFPRLYSGLYMGILHVSVIWTPYSQGDLSFFQNRLIVLDRHVLEQKNVKHTCLYLLKCHAFVVAYQPLFFPEAPSTCLWCLPGHQGSHLQSVRLLVPFFCLIVPVCFYHSPDCSVLWLGTLSLCTVSHACCQDQHWLIVNFTGMNTVTLYWFLVTVVDIF